MIKPMSAAFVGIAAIGVTTAFATAQTVIRIEPRPYYGATISIEEGVRVFRGLPGHSNIIINPGHRTPLTLNIDSNGKVSRGGTTNNVNVNTRIIRPRVRQQFRVNPPIR